MQESQFSPAMAPRFYVAQPLSIGATVSLPDATARHIQALRLRQSDRVALFNGDGHEYAADLVNLSKRAAVVRIRSRESADRESPLAVTLAQGICAADRMDLVIQKATELGVHDIVPLVTRRSVIRLSAERQERRESHWRNVAIAACEQCRRNRIPEVGASMRFDAFIASDVQAGAKLFLALDGEDRIAGLPKPRSVLLVVGPEGGLAADEQALLRDRGYRAVRFGPRVLRSETAPIAALAAMGALWGDC